MKKMLLILFSLILLINITGCNSKEEKQSNTKQQEQKQEEKENNNQQSNLNNNTYPNQNSNNTLDIQQLRNLLYFHPQYSFHHLNK